MEAAGCWPRLARRAGSIRRAALAAAIVVAAAGFARAAVDDPDTIDALQALPERPLVVMVIVQDRPWNAETRVMLGNKLGGYLRYALGGQLARDVLHAAGRPVRIVLVSETMPGEEDLAVLASFGEQVAAAGIAFVWGGEADLAGMVGAK